MSALPSAAWSATAAVLTTLLLTPLVRKAAISRGLSDLPGQGRAHEVPTARMGGLAIAAGVFVGLGVLAVMSTSHLRFLVWVAVGAAVVTVVGIVDDMAKISPRVRVLAESLAGLAAMAALSFEFSTIGPLVFAAGICLVVLIVNSVNLLDNLDGSSSSVVGATAVVAAFATLDQGFPKQIAWVLAGICAAFLVYNWNPAKIFMGDAGALLLGYLLAMTVLGVSLDADGLTDQVIATALMLAVPLFDTVLVVISRRRAHRPISVGGTDHLTHRLRRLGLSVRSAAATQALAAGLVAALGALVAANVFTPLTTLVLVLVAAVPALVFLLRLPVYAYGVGRPVTASQASKNDPGMTPAN